MQSPQTYEMMFFIARLDIDSRTVESTADTIRIPRTVATDENAPGATSERIFKTVFKSHPASNDDAISEGVASSEISGR